MKGTGMKNHPTSMIPITTIPMMPMEDPMLDFLPTTNSQRKMLPRNIPRKKLRNGKLLLSMPWALGDLAEDDPVDCTSLGEALQLELAALAAFGKASGKGENKGKGKSKGKLVRSNLTLEQR